MFHKFLYKFRSYFKLPCIDKKNPPKLVFKTWDDKKYSSFMIKFMQKLEPRQFFKGDLILQDQDDVDEIYFVMKGEYVVGYTINNKEYLVLKLGERNAIGDISMMFSRHSEFLYRAITDIEC